MRNFYNNCKFSTLTINFWEVWRLEEVFARRLEDVLRRYCKTSWRRFGKTFWRSMTKTNILVLITTSWRRLEDAWLRRTCSSWSRRYEDGLETSSQDEDEKRLQDVFKTSSSRWMFAGYPVNCSCQKPSYESKTHLKNIKYFLLKVNLDSHTNFSNIQHSHFRSSRTKLYV